LCIIGATIYCTEINGAVVGGWVPDSFKVWPASNLAAPTDGEGKGGKKRTLDDQVTIDDDKYIHHGNMNQVLFNKWFEGLCQTLRRQFGQCHIIMDGARYHKERIDPPPAANAPKAQFVNWLKEKEILHPPDLTRLQLYDLVREHKERHTKYTSVVVAEKHGHSLVFLPPYHPELNAIERVWACLKNPLAKVAAAHTLSTLSDEVQRTAATISPEQFKNSWEYMMENAKTYFHLRQEDLEPIRARPEEDDEDYDDFFDGEIAGPDVDIN
jgi:transposase